jgi:hypothetical protein
MEDGMSEITETDTIVMVNWPTGRGGPYRVIDEGPTTLIIEVNEQKAIVEKSWTEVVPF